MNCPKCGLHLSQYGASRVDETKTLKYMRCLCGFTTRVLFVATDMGMARKQPVNGKTKDKPNG
jgi:hypothetical protein